MAQSAEKNWADTTLAKQYIEAANQLNHSEKHAASLEKAAQAVAIYTRLCGPVHPKTANAQLYVARELRELGRFPAAVALFQQSLLCFESARDTPKLALCYNNLSLCFSQQQRMKEARAYLQSAITVLRGGNASYASLLAGFHVNLANLYIAEKNYRAAIPLLDSAKLVYTDLKDLRYLGFAEYHLGNAYSGLQDYLRSKECFLNALSNLQKAETPPDHSFFADLKVKIGRCCQKTAEAEIGLSWLLEAKTMYLKAGPNDPNYIAFLQEFGQFYFDEKQYTAAITQLETCLAAREKQHGASSPRLVNTLRLLGEACLQARLYDRSAACFRRGLRIVADSLDDNYPLAYRFYGKLAEGHFLQGDLQNSLRLCDTAFAAAHFDPKRSEDILPRDFFRDLCQLYAQIHLGLYRQYADTVQLFKAEHYFDLAAQTLHRELTEIATNSSREIFYDLDHPVLEQWLDARMLLFERTQDPVHAQVAFQIAGQSKSFLLSEAMRRNGLLPHTGVPDSVIQAELVLQGKILDAEKKLENVDHRGSTQIDSAVLRTNAALLLWRNQYEALLRNIGTQYPGYFRLRFLRNDVPLHALQHKWLAPDQSLLLYSLSETSLYTFVLTRDTFCVHTLPLDSTLKQEMALFRESFTTYFTAQNPEDALYDRQLEQFVALGQSLYQKLVAPIAPLLSGRVLIIPEQELCYLPFDALLTATPPDIGNFRTYPFWFRKKAISYGLSPQVLIETTTPQTLKAAKNWLGLAPFAEMPVPDGPYSALPYSGKEVREIASLLRGDAWLGTAAAPGRFQQEASHYRVLHLATHSYADDRRGHYAYLTVSNTGPLLYAKDLYQFRLSADMVVLSACEAGSGRLLRGEGIIGLVRAFTFAGAKSVVASQWVANDQSTAQLMVDFYRQLQKGQPKDIALQTARLRLLDWNSAESHPFFWAGFKVYGNVETLWR